MWDLAQSRAIKKYADLKRTPDVDRAIQKQAGRNFSNMRDAVVLGTGAGYGVIGKTIYDKQTDQKSSVPKGKVEIQTLSPSDQLNYVVPKSKYRTEPNTDPTIIPQSKEPLKPSGHPNKAFAVKTEGAGVLAGGMSNFEEGRYYDPMGDERREQQAMDNERRDFKRREMEYELRNEPKNNYAVAIDGRVWKVFGDRQQAENIARSLVRKGKKATVHITGASISEEQAPMFTPESKIDEKKDACYSKVKSRYKVWPSAYASGALVKCRKVGASNWRNKSKK